MIKTKLSICLIGATCVWSAALSCVAPAHARQVETTDTKNVSASQDARELTERARAYQFGDGVVLDYSQAAFWYQKAADQGYALAQAGLADLYASGLGVANDFNIAADLYEKAALQGVAHAQHGLALIFEKKLSDQDRQNEAPALYQLAAKQGFAESQTSLGVLYQEGKLLKQDYMLAKFWYEKAAEQGHAKAQNNLGTLYTKGLGVEQDYTAAAEWYRLAAEAGLEIAMTNLGVMYENGFGVEQSDDEATKWYRLGGSGTPQKAYTKGPMPTSDLTAVKREAQHGNSAAQYELALRYFTGATVPQDYVLAYKWTNLAISGGYTSATDLRDDLTERMLTSQINEAQTLIRNWKPTNK